LSEPKRIGPWRVQWWRRYPDGYRIDIDSPYQGDNFWRLERPLADPERLPQVIHRHGLVPAEWCILSALDSRRDRRASALVRNLVRFPDKSNGPALSEAEYEAGLRGCLRYGWAQVLQAGSILAIRNALRNDPAEPADPLLGQPGELDFTSAGAELYQTACAEVYGPDWDAELYLERTFSWWMHSYSETEECVRARLHEGGARGVRPLSVRGEALGPWCSHWWERFPAGYRLDVEFGSPAP
jgi:hypothetical protein